MASASSDPQIREAVQSSVQHLRRLKNDYLKQICRTLTLPVSGVKASLQSRIENVLRDASQRNDYTRLNRIRRAINPGAVEIAPSPTLAPSYSTSSPALGSSQLGSLSNGSSSRNGVCGSMARQMPSSPMPDFNTTDNALVRFKESPFYQLLDRLSPPTPMLAMPSNRQTVQNCFSLGQQLSQQIAASSAVRVMLYCHAEMTMINYGARVDVAFPHNIEVHVNHNPVRANYKGLKNKPGSTRPVDITPFIRKHPDFKNEVAVTYALTTQRFELSVFSVRKHSIDELVGRITRIIEKQAVINEFLKAASDPDIVATSTVMSLKDPVSTVRITVPCRSAVCNHNQCFDASTFLQLQEQAPTWACPICQKTVSFESLAVDEYFKEILQETSTDTSQITIEPDGKWHVGDWTATATTSNGAQKANNNDADDADSSDIIEITDSRPTASLKPEPSPSVPPPPSSFSKSSFHINLTASTPPISSREASSVPRSVSRPTTSLAGSKRPAAEVIDLTLSSDDEDARPVKKQAYIPSATTGAPSSSNSPAAFHHQQQRYTMPPLPSASPAAPP
ncbi:PINIT domain-containing protein, partial [Lineolata rhizophorae]